MRSFKSNNVIKERVELYKDFTLNLLYHIYNTYLGNQFISSDEDILGHFKWAFDKVLDEFLEEEIIFFESKNLFNYFYAYYYSQFYKMDKIHQLSYYVNFWKDIFYVKNQKTNKKKFQVLLEMYELFDQCLNKKINIEEILV